MSDLSPSIDELERVLSLMGEHQVLELTYRGCVIRRTLDVPRPAPRETQESELERLARMSPDQQDAALMLRRVGR